MDLLPDCLSKKKAKDVPLLHFSSDKTRVNMHIHFNFHPLSFSNVKGIHNWGALDLEVINLGCPTSAPSRTGVLFKYNSHFVEVGRVRLGCRP